MTSKVELASRSAVDKKTGLQPALGDFMPSSDRIGDRFEVDMTEAVRRDSSSELVAAAAQDGNFVSTYLAEAAIYPLLTISEERKLGREIKLGRSAFAALKKNTRMSEKDMRQNLADLEAGRIARTTLILSNTRLVADIAKKFRKVFNNTMPMSDIIQSGSYGLIEAADRYDPNRFKDEKEGRFSTYATYWIRREIWRQYPLEHLIRLPVGVTHAVRHFLFETERVRIRKGDIPLEQIAAELNLPIEKAREYDRISRDPVSLDASMSDNVKSGTYGENTEDRTMNPESEALIRVFEEIIRNAVSGLNHENRIIFEDVFGFYGKEPVEEQSLAPVLGITKQAINDRKKKQLKRWRDQWAELDAVYVMMLDQKVENIW